MSVEVLAPGGSVTGMKAAIAAGADAVYMGGRLFGARAYADNPDEKDLLDAIDFCHLMGKKLYLTVNTLLKEEELEKKLYDYLQPLYERGLDAALIQDQGVVQFVKNEFPDLPIHASTQMSVQSPDGARLLAGLGAERIVPARELSLREIKEIHEQPDLKKLEIECFVHGALCYSYSGQCLMSSMIGGRSGNRGRCAQPCRQTYRLYENERELRNKDGSYLLSLKDINTLELLPDLIEAGVCSLKIEGRMKQPAYAAGVSAVYRKYVDLYLENGKAGYLVDPEDQRYLMDLYNRGGFSNGYYQLSGGPAMLTAGKPDHIGTEAARIVKTAGRQVQLRALEDLSAGDLLGTGVPFTLTESVKKGKVLQVPAWKGMQSGDIIRRLRSSAAAERAKAASEQPLSVKIKGIFRMRPGTSAILNISDIQETVSVTVQGEIPQQAQKRATGSADVEKALRKTGGTVFTWHDLKTEVEDGLFYPLTALNEMRRAALAELEQKLLQRYRRSLTADAESSVGDGKRQASSWKENRTAGDFSVTCFVREEEQLEAVLSSKLPRRVVMDSLLWLDGRASVSAAECMDQIHAAGKQAVLAMPPVWRKLARDNWQKYFAGDVLSHIDGLLVRCQDELPAAAEWKSMSEGRLHLTADHNLYAWNKRAQQFWLDWGIDELTLPLELNSRELADLDMASACMVVYGRAAMMTSAQCLMKNTEGCRHQDARLMMQDKTGARFPVNTHCGICSNVIYNSLPLDLTGQLQENRFPDSAGIRLDLTVESGAETEQLLLNFSAAMQRQTENEKPQGRKKRSNRNDQNNYPEHAGAALGPSTRGHYKRGVE